MNEQTTKPESKRDTAVAMMQEIAAGWAEKTVGLKAAAIAFYAMLSLAPLLAFIISMVGFFFSESSVEREVLTAISDTLGAETAELVAGVIDSAFKTDSSGPILAIIGLFLILFFASTVFNSVKIALNAIWDVTPEEAPHSGIVAFLWNRLLAAVMVLLTGAALLIMMLASVVSATLSRWLGDQVPELGDLVTFSGQWVGVLVVLFLVTVGYKLLPDVSLRWRQVLPGSLLATVLFLVGNYFMGFYFSLSSLPTVYGAAGSLVVLLLWVYYSSYIFLFGALFTKSFADRFFIPTEAG